MKIIYGQKIKIMMKNKIKKNRIDKLNKTVLKSQFKKKRIINYFEL